MTAVANPTPRRDVAALAALHLCPSQRELEGAVAIELERGLPGVGMALGLADDGGELRVCAVVGSGLGLAVGTRVEPGGSRAVERLPIRYRTYSLGSLWIDRVLSPEERAFAVAAVTHFGTAVGNLALNEESRQATAAYCASLQALEEGIVLFQEEDPEAVMARLLSLATSMAQATAGALFVLREVGNRESGLGLEQTLGIPEQLVAAFKGINGCPWPDVLLGEQAQLASRTPDGALALLSPESVPPALQGMVVLPLRYHGVEAGLCLLFNPSFDAVDQREVLSRVQSLGQLGAALLHRLRLEALNARNRSRERELQIAETIQKRLLPTSAPTAAGLTFAWGSIAAQQIGGDYLDVFQQDAGVVHAIVADASGHGINSALLMSSFRSNYRANAPRHTVEALTAFLNNEVVNEVGPTGMFITAALLHIDPAARRMRVASAGHTPVMLLRGRSGTVEQLESSGPPLGFLHGAEFTARSVDLEAGDIVLLYTDGVTEAANADCDMFGEERLEQLLRAHAHNGPDAILKAVRESLVAFTGRTRYEDDVSMLVVCAT